MTDGRNDDTRYAAAALAGFAATYARDGVVHIPGLLDAEWVQRLVRIIGEARQSLQQQSATPPVGVPDAAAARAASGGRTAEYSHAPGRFTIRWLWRDDAEVRRFFTHSGVAPVVAAVIGAQRLQYWYDLTFIHDPGADGAGSPWHHDIAAFPCKGTQIPSLWIAMSDIDESMSPLRCIRGSHRNPLMFRPPVYVDQQAAVPAGYGDMPDVEALIATGEYESITWNCRAGDALLIHPYTLHGAPSNRSTQSRIAFTTRWAGDDVVWRPDALSMRVPGVDLSKVPVGQRPDGPFFPYI
jgi:ectoine hydroxylase-related dioxygenase (phytanoyl-CoA dioxygenase family)